MLVYDSHENVNYACIVTFDLLKNHFTKIKKKSFGMHSLPWVRNAFHNSSLTVNLGLKKHNEKALLEAANEYYEKYNESNLPPFRYLPIFAYLLTVANW